jgi:hypothetical protein
MDGTLNAVNAAREPVVEAPKYAAAAGAAAEDFSTGPKGSAKAPAGELAAPRQSAEENARFARFRRETEAARAEAQKLREGRERLLGALASAGLRGEELWPAPEAAGQPGPELSGRREATSGVSAEYAAPIWQAAAQGVFARDLAEINEAFPEAKLKSVDQLGSRFLTLRAAGVDSLTVTGGAGGATGDRLPAPTAREPRFWREKEYYSPANDQLYPAQLDNPGSENIS